MKNLGTPSVAVRLAMAGSIACIAGVAQADGVLARCGPSEGRAYFFYDQLTNPDGPGWVDDGIPTGKIILVRLGDEWDIQFDDAIGAYGYRNGGAQVVPLARSENNFTIGAFDHNFAEIYTFDRQGSEVAWSSHKHGPIIAKVAVNRSACSLISDELFLD